MNPESAILQALLQHLRDGAAGASPAFPPIKWPDEPFEYPKTADGKPEPYIEPFFLPGRPTGLFVQDGDDVHVGVLQLGIFWPDRRWMLIEATALADRLGRLFKAETEIYYDGVRIDVNEAPAQGPIIRVSDGLPQLPVSVTYEARIERATV
jgi:hypothetical protein